MTRTHRPLLALGCLIGAVVLPPTPLLATALELGPSAAVVRELASARVPFIENEGQIEAGDVRFYARTFAGTVFVTGDGGIVYALAPTSSGPDAGRWAFRESFATGRTGPVGLAPSGIRVSRFIGPDPAAWRSDLPVWDGVDLAEPFPGIGVTLQASGGNVEKLFHVAPGADVETIEVAVEGAKGLSVDPEGRLVLDTGLGDVTFTAPFAYQTVDGERIPVEVAYALREGDRYGFRVGPYDRAQGLVIDPLLESTYLGGHNDDVTGNYDDDFITTLLVADDAIYVAGVTQSPDFPIVLGYDPLLEGTSPEGFVARFSHDLSTVLSSTYIGTAGFDRVSQIALDDTGLVAVGQASYGFPVTDGAYTWSGTTPTGGGFVARFSRDLSTLLASSIPTPSDYPSNVAIGNGGVYFSGTTTNPDFPVTPGAWRTTCCPSGPFGIREAEGFAGKLSSDLSTLEAMTYLDGSSSSAIAVAPNGSVFVTDGFDYAITGFLARFDALLTTRSAYLSYYPGSISGSSRTYFNDVVAMDGYVIAAGQTYQWDLPATPGAYDETCGTDGLCDGVGALLVPRADGFVAIYSDDLATTTALTFLGGSDHESVRGLAVGGDGSIYAVGETTSVDFPTVGEGVDDECGTDGSCNPTGMFDSPTPDGFVVRFSADLSELLFGTYLGGTGDDRPLVVSPSPDGSLYVAGYTRSEDFPTTAGAFDHTWNGGTSDAFVSRFDAGAPVEMLFADGFESGDMLRWSD